MRTRRRRRRHGGGRRRLVAVHHHHQTTTRPSVSGAAQRRRRRRRRALRLYVDAASVAPYGTVPSRVNDAIGRTRVVDTPGRVGEYDNNKRKHNNSVSTFRRTTDDPTKR